MKSKATVLTAVVLTCISLSLNAFAEIKSAAYIVPPSDKIKTTLVYNINKPTISENLNGERVIDFKLPEDLVGNGGKYELTEIKQRNSPFAMFTDGTLFISCSESDQLMNCVMKYPNTFSTEYSADVVTVFLNKKFANNPVLLKEKLAQMKAFVQDPEGVLLIYLK